MVFCVYLDPACIGVVDDGGGVGSDHLVGVVQRLLESCFIAETSSWNVGSELAREVERLRDPDTRLRMGVLLETLKKRDRFVDVVDDSALAADVTLTEVAAAQGANPHLDVVITEWTPEAPTGLEYTPIDRFNRSRFEETRRRLVTEGVTTKPGQLGPAALFSRSFGRMLLGCDVFRIEDYLISKDFSDNYYRNLPHWCTFFATSGRPTKVTIITQTTTPATLRSLENRLVEISKDTSVQFAVKTVAKPRHERFFQSAAFSFVIGRGIDLCDENDLNRDVTVCFGK